MTCWLSGERLLPFGLLVKEPPGHIFSKFVVRQVCARSARPDQTDYTPNRKRNATVGETHIIRNWPIEMINNDFKIHFMGTLPT